MLPLADSKATQLADWTVAASTQFSWFRSNRRCTSSRDVYTYDGNGTLLKRAHLVDGSANWVTQSSTVYIAGVDERTDTGAVTKYYTAFGRTLALAQTPAGGGAATVSYPLLDHLGSTTAVTSSTGAVVATQAYWPYGAQRSASGITQTDKLYTGQQREQGDPALGLYNYRARFYSTTLGRFVSADTVADGLNRYAYVRGNPLRYTDPADLTPCTGPPNLCE